MAGQGGRRGNAQLEPEPTCTSQHRSAALRTGLHAGQPTAATRPIPPPICPPARCRPPLEPAGKLGRGGWEHLGGDYANFFFAAGVEDGATLELIRRHGLEGYFSCWVESAREAGATDLCGAWLSRLLLSDAPAQQHASGSQLSLRRLLALCAPCM